ncbi:hypothetical protein BDA96_05G214600 [Sorghum bicolor]|uniref:NB-ARC domain-containing protein n=1 Tax=Sorghum bicolor TaxID=4558 RepID=A0A921QZB1_SORBI|nr:hypothetical protein BDA96_05G214600 [Sorghum bicolor]
MGDIEGARDLNRVVAMLLSPRMEEKFQFLRADTLLEELRSAVSLVHTGATTSSEASLRLIFSVRSLGLVSNLRELLEAVLNMQTSRANEWHQVPAVLYRYHVFRSSTLRDLRYFLDKFRSLATYALEQTPDSLKYGYESSMAYGIDARDRYRDTIIEPMVGRSELVDKIVSTLLADRTGDTGLFVLPIVGGPGVGKSRLAKAILHDDRVKHKFSVRLVVPVTQNFRRTRIYTKMVSSERPGDNVQGSLGVIFFSPEAMVNHIGAKLNGGDYLIVLDDVWSDNEDKWRQIGAMMKALPSNGRVILTTRTPDIISKLVTIVETTNTKPCYLKPLGPEFSSWFVARWMATYCGDWPAELIREAGTKIADKCGGVPFLLDYVRQFFCQPLGLHFWRQLPEENTGNKIHPEMFWSQLLVYIDKLPSDKFWQRFLLCCLEVPGGGILLESASVSYQRLPYDLRNCFSYCSMFPSDFDFDLEELTDLLAAEGSIPPIVAKAQRKGFLKQLLDECFYLLQEHEYGDRTTYRMHKVFHIFAQNKLWGTSSVIRVDELNQLTDTKATDRIPTSIRRASLVVNPLTAAFPRSLFACNNLGALVLLHDGGMRPPDQPLCEIAEIPQEFSKSFRSIHSLSFSATKIRVLPIKFLDPNLVKYLNLSQTPIDNIPSSISRLLFLQTLILSHCDKLQKLHPNITKLVMLQKLDLEGCCNLLELPRDMGKIKSLEYLNVTQCSSLTQLPRGMGQLESLQMLLGYIVSYTDGSSMSELQPLANLHRLSLQSLEKVSDPLDVRFARLDSKTNLESLSLQWNMDDDSNDVMPAYAVLESLRPHQRLKALEIVGYEGDKLPLWIMGKYLKSLVEIKLISLRSCELLPLGLLPCLRIAEISGVETICSVNDNFCGRKGIFPSLQKLTFSCMENLEVWEQAQRADMFPRLIELEFIQCPKLRALHMELPLLEKLILWMNNKVLYDQKGALQGVAKNLENVSISFSEELASSDCEGLQDLGKLTKLEICGCDELTCLPQGLQRLSSIRTLTIDNCRKLETLPDWLEFLPSLQIIRLSGCPLLHYIPGGLQERPGVIIYVEDCPSLIQDHLPNFSAQSSGEPVGARVNKGKEIVQD